MKFDFLFFFRWKHNGFLGREQYKTILGERDGLLPAISAARIVHISEVYTVGYKQKFVQAKEFSMDSVQFNVANPASEAHAANTSIRPAVKSCVQLIVPPRGPGWLVVDPCAYHLPNYSKDSSSRRSSKRAMDSVAIHRLGQQNVGRSCPRYKRRVSAPRDCNHLQTHHHQALKRATTAQQKDNHLLCERSPS